MRRPIERYGQTTWPISDPGSAATFAGAIAAATLAFVAVVFATTLVAIQLAASQYSPRTVRIFIRSRITRVTLGLFLATFVFSVIDPGQRPGVGTPRLDAVRAR